MTQEEQTKWRIELSLSGDAGVLLGGALAFQDILDKCVSPLGQTLIAMAIAVFLHRANHCFDTKQALLSAAPPSAATKCQDGQLPSLDECIFSTVVGHSLSLISSSHLHILKAHIRLCFSILNTKISRHSMLELRLDAGFGC